MPWLVKPYSRRQLTREERIANYRISRGRRVVENYLSRVLLTTMEQRPKVVRDIVLTCVVLHNIRAADRPPTPADDIQPHQGDQGGQGHQENFRNTSREDKHQRDLLKDYFNHVGCWLGRRTKFKKTEGRILRGRRCCHISVLFRTTQTIQEILFSKVLPPQK